MKKALILIMAAVLAAAVLACGCGGSKKDETQGEAEKVLMESNKKMADVQTVKIAGSVLIEMPEAEEKEESYDFEILSSNEGGEPQAQAVIRSGGQEFQTYVVGGWAYTNDPNRGWVKQQVDTLEDVSSSGVMTHEQLGQMSKYAENQRLLPDESGNYVVAFDVSEKFFDEYLSGFQEVPEGDAPGQEEASEVSGLLQDLLKDMKISIIMKIDRQTYLVDEAEISMVMKDIPLMGDVSADTGMLFTEYDQPVTIALPPEASGAKELQYDGGLPNIPGLGL